MNQKPRNSYEFFLCSLRRALKRRSFEEKEYAYWVRNNLCVELHDDRQFYVWKQIDEPLIDIKLNKHNYPKVFGRLKALHSKELAIFLKTDKR